MLRLLRLISWPQFRLSWGRAALVVGGIATGVALIVAINVINDSVLASFQHTIELIAGPAALEVTLGVGEVGFPETVSDLVAADRDVAMALPLVRGTVSLASDPAEALQLFGADLVTEEQIGRYSIRTTTDRREAVNAALDTHSILLTAAFASAHGVKVGDTLALSTPRGVVDATVRGLLEAQGLAAAFGGQLAVMDLNAAQSFLVKSGRLDQIDVVLRSGADVDQVRARLVQALPSSLTIARPSQRGVQYESVLASFQAMLTGISLLCLVAGIYIVYNTTSTGAAHRALTLAALRVVGAESAQLFRLLMWEAVALGAVGAMIGIPIGIGLARALTTMVSASMSVIFQLRFASDRISLDVGELCVVGVLGILATLVASYSAARRVSLLDPLEVIRADVSATGSVVRPRRLVAVWLVLVGISAAALVLEVERKSITWGNLGSTLWFASSIVIAIPLVAWLATFLSRTLPRLFGPEGRIAAESLFRSPMRTGVTVAAVALVMTVAITSSSLSQSLSRSISTYFSGGFLACDLAVSAVTTDGGWLEIPLPEELGKDIASIDGVRDVDLIRILPGQLFRGERIAIGGGSDGIFDPARYARGWFHAGDPVSAVGPLRAGTGANISASLAGRFDLSVGDHFELDSPTGPVSLQVVGIVPDYMSDRGSVILSRRLLVERWQDHSVNRVHVFLRPGMSAETVRREIQARLGDRYKLKVLFPSEVVAYHAAQVDRAFALMSAIQLLVIVVTVAGILDLLLSAILERRRELALWRTIGADERAVRRSVVLESATIGVSGAALGVVLGFVTAWIWVTVNFRYLLGYYLDYHFAAAAAAWLVALVMIMTVVAGYGAATRANRQSIIDGLHVE